MSEACITLDSLASFVYSEVVKENKSHFLLRLFSSRPEILSQLSITMLNIVLYEDCQSQWAISRPLLPLVILNEQASIPVFWQNSIIVNDRHLLDVFGDPADRH